MGFMDELKKFKRNSVDEDDLDDYEDEEGLEDDRITADENQPAGFAQPAAGRSGSKIVNLNNSSQTQLVLVRPKRYEEVKEIANHLLERRAVLLNLEVTEGSDRRRLIDFLGGCALAIDGEMRKTAEKAYVIVPHNFKLMGISLEELEEKAKYE